MAEKKVEIKIKTATYIDGDLAKVDSVHTVTASCARTLMATGKAVPAGGQIKQEKKRSTKA